MGKLYLLLGGNLGDKQKIFEVVRSQLKDQLGEICQQSSIYETEPWGFSSPNLFWNQALAITTTFSPMQVLEITQQIETNLGRTRNDNQYESRCIDIDILFYDDLIIQRPNLIVPHPRIHERRFVLLPMCELAPDFVHPLFQKKIADLLQECTDQLNASPIATPVLK
jgi:2-amino-4-hydroxy-6-hydroxymethyldihydropteridine diphosphokinase